MFVVGYSGELAELQLILKHADAVLRVYTGGLKQGLLGGRNQYASSMASLKQQVDLSRQCGVGFDVALNAPCLGAKHLQPVGRLYILKILRELEDIGVNGAILSDPNIIELTKNHTRLEVTVSVISMVETVDKALFFEELGGDFITISPTLNRKLTLLEKMKDALTRAKPVLLVNEGCLLNCPFRLFHYNLLSHADEQIERDYYHANCRFLRIKNPAHLIRSPVIRPEDLHYYQHISSIFKIASRKMRYRHRVVDILQAYINGKYRGNLLDLLNCENSDDISTFFIDNTKLDGILESVWRDRDHGNDCSTCQFCDRLASKVVQKR